jgi:hypothetical protein
MMSDATPGGGTALAEAVAEVSGMAKKKGMVMVASDLITGWEAVVGLLGVLASRGHAVLVLHTLSTEELTFPFSGSVVFRSEETGESALLDARGLKKRYLAAVNGFLAAVRRACHEAGVFYFQVDVNNPPHVGVAEAMRGF